MEEAIFSAGSFLEPHFLIMASLHWLNCSGFVLPKVAVDTVTKSCRLPITMAQQTVAQYGHTKHKYADSTFGHSSHISTRAK